MAATECARRICAAAGCGRIIKSTDPRKRFCDTTCGGRERQRRFKAARKPVSCALDLYREHIAGLIAAGSISPEDGLLLAIFPNADCVAHLERQAA